MKRCRAEVRRIAAEGRFAQLSTLAGPHLDALNTAANPRNPAPSDENELEYIKLLTFQPRLVANQIRSSLIRMKTVDELPPQTRANAERALKPASALFGKEKQFWSQSA